MTGTPFNPLDMENLGQSIANSLLGTDPTRMDRLPGFPGAGVYAIYYTGSLSVYSLLGMANEDGRFAVPIYVGKAVPAGARKGVAVATATRALASRLRQHASSVGAATNLNIEDFHARWLICEPIWIPLGESLLIGRFAPVWNTIVDGFGNHDPGRGRHAGMVSRWDVLHPGRPWAHKYQTRTETQGHIDADVKEYLAQRIQVY